MPEHSYDKYADQAGKMKTENVNVIALDDIFDAFIPDSVSIPLVKIDVEGLEHRVKTGMSRALASGQSPSRLLGTQRLVRFRTV